MSNQIYLVGRGEITKLDTPSRWWRISSSWSEILVASSSRYIFLISGYPHNPLKAVHSNWNWAKNSRLNNHLSRNTNFSSSTFFWLKKIESSTLFSNRFLALDTYIDSSGFSNVWLSQNKAFKGELDIGRDIIRQTILSFLTTLMFSNLFKYWKPRGRYKCLKFFIFGHVKSHRQKSWGEFIFCLFLVL
jgi:hypothetical protein